MSPIILTMKKVNIFEAKARLSEYLDLVEGGERIVICRRNRPIAELRALPEFEAWQRPLGGTALRIPAMFFDTLPADVEDSFYAPPITTGRGTSTAAERHPRPYRTSKRPSRTKR